MLSSHQISGHKPTSFNHLSQSIPSSSLKLRLILEKEIEDVEEAQEEEVDQEEEEVATEVVVAVDLVAEEEVPEVVEEEVLDDH